ncbi:MAG TPA: helix-turn-helix domain-containing protein [Tahibacter sp.]|nr:helix-turn-helix domain-containing protein [Tahibacter sp.]
MLKPASTRPRGILRRHLDPARLRYGRYLPAPDLAPYVEHYWAVAWDLRGQPPQLQETMPHPNVHVVVDPSGSGAFGVHSGRFVCELAGVGRVFGIKFRPGGFRPFLGRRVATLANCSARIGDVFGADGDAYERDVLACGDVERCVALAEGLLTAHSPAPDPTVARVAAIVADIAADRELTTAERLAQRCGVSLRALQRLFGDYVGASPKWVINRYRLHEAIERLAAGTAVDWADLALQLGYFDQAHFNRDFRKLVGRSPGEFVRAEGPR